MLQTTRETPDSFYTVRRYGFYMAAVGDPACFLAEWYLPELTEHAVDDIVARLDDAAAAVTAEGTPIRILVTLSVPTDEVLYCVFGAPSREIVSRTCMQAGTPHQRLSDDIGARIRQVQP